MTNRTARRKSEPHRALVYFELGEYILKQKRKSSPERSKAIASKAESLGITPSDLNLQRARKFSVVFSRELIQLILDLPVVESDRPLSFEHFVLLSDLSNDSAMEQMARDAARLGLNKKEFREHINLAIHGKQSRRPGVGRRRRVFASSESALMFCRDQLGTIDSAIEDLEPLLNDHEQRQQCAAFKKKLQLASASLRLLAKICDIEINEPEPAPKSFDDLGFEL